MRIIRKYTSSDWPVVSDIYAQSKPDEMAGIVESHEIVPLEQDDRMRHYFSESEIWVFEEGSLVTGFIGLKGNYISWLFVHPNSRRRGIARKLLRKVIDQSNACLMLNIVKSNRAAMSLYHQLGFKVLEEFEGEMYGHKIPAVRMKLNRIAEPLVPPGR